MRGRERSIDRHGVGVGYVRGRPRRSPTRAIQYELIKYEFGRTDQIKYLLSLPSLRLPVVLVLP